MNPVTNHGSRVLLLGLAGTLLLSACGGNDSGSDAKSSGKPKPSSASAAQRKPLDYNLVKPIAEQEMGHDPGCGYGEWGTNSTGIDKPFRDQATNIYQFDCWEKKGAIFPNAGQQAIFITFNSPDQAQAYVKAQSATVFQAVGYLQDQANVLEAHQGYLHLDRVKFLKDAQAACGGCGTLTTTSLANSPTPGYVSKT